MTLTRVLCGVLATVIASVALVVSISFYSSYGTDDATQAVFIILAVISAGIKFVAPAAAAGLRGFRFVQACLWVGFAAAVVFDSFGVAGYVEITYGSKSGEASRYADDYKKASGDVSKLETEYQNYAATRPTAEVAAALEAAKGLAGNCGPRRAHLDVCKAVSDLEQEQARADERDKREKLWREAKAKFDKLTKPSVTADPQAAVIARLGSRIGFEGLGDFVALIISILIFIFFEVVGPSLMFAALHGQSSRKWHDNPAKAPEPARKPAKRQAKSSPATPSSLEALQAVENSDGVAWRDGRLVGSQRALGVALGVSGAKVNAILRELRDAGSISTRTVPDGTEISFL
jgi:hypothetical protein